MNPHIRTTLESVASGAVAIAALVIAATTVYREIISPRSASGGASAPKGEYLTEWKELLPATRSVDDAGAELMLLEFTDLECPACRRFQASTLPELRRAAPVPFELGLLHLPLTGHRFAKIAAHAAECAFEQGAFMSFVNEALSRQAEFGLTPWSSLAKDAGVTDSTAFHHCLSRPDLPAMIDSGLAAAQRFGINATPTIVVNGWRVSSASPDEILRVMNELVAGRKPYD